MKPLRKKWNSLPATLNTDPIYNTPAALTGGILCRELFLGLSTHRQTTADVATHYDKSCQLTEPQ